MTARPRKILVVAACPFPFPRGTPARILRLSEALADRGHEVHVATYPIGRGSARGVSVTRTPSVPLYRSGAPGPSWTKLLVLDPLLVRVVRRLAARVQPDVFHAHHYEGLLVSLAARGRRSVPVVYDAHTTLRSELPLSGMIPGRALKRALGGWLDRSLVPRADAVTCVNESLAAEVATYLEDDAALVTVPNGVEVERFLPPRPARGGSGGARRLVFSGNLAEYQGIDLMLRAFARVAEVDPLVRLSIVTSMEPSLGRYDGLADALGIRGRIDHTLATFEEVPALLAASNVALHPRRPCAGTPLKLLNYMAASLPIVSFEGSGRGLVHGETARLVPDDDVEAFSAAVLEVLENPEEATAMGRKARSTVVERNAWAGSVRILEDVFSRVIDGGARRQSGVLRSDR